MEERHQRRINEYEDMVLEAMTTAERDRYTKAKSEINSLHATINYLHETISHKQQLMTIAQIEARNTRNSVIERSQLPDFNKYVYGDEWRTGE